MYFDLQHIRKFTNDLEALRFRDFMDVANIHIKEVFGKINLGVLKNTDIASMASYTCGSVYETEGNRYHIFKFKLKVNPLYDKKTLVLRITTGFGCDWNESRNPNFLLFINGDPVQGYDQGHRECIISECAKAYDEYEMFLFEFSGMRSGSVQMTLKTCALDHITEDFYYDMLCPGESIQYIESEIIKQDTARYLMDAVNMCDLREPYSEEYYASVKKADDYIKNEYYGKYCDDDTAKVIVSGMGHTHIDVAWRWPLKETRQKTVRTFSTMLTYMKEFDDFRFMSSQPQLYKFIMEEYPELMDGIKKAVADGKWSPEGAMWLEADCNLISGESFVRQIMHGKRFFKEQFGIDNRILWLPDVFGYSAALPQILKKSGIDYFTTSKISWNEFNVIPYNTFMWEGIDGSQVFTNFIVSGRGPDEDGKPRVNYNSHIDANHMMGTWENYRDKGLSNNPMMTFGLGDGGGGPKRDHLEQAIRFKKGIKGMPKFENVAPLSYFDKLYNSVKDNSRLPKWVGELYLELHRGTYTSIAKNKKNNRKSEILLRDTEIFSAFADKQGIDAYPKKELYDTWETVLLNQFHDIIPGSSIKEVYDDSDIDYARIMKNGREMLTSSLHSFIKTVKGEELCVVFNQLAFKRADCVRLRTDKEYSCVYDIHGEMTPGQMVVEDDKNYFIFEAKLCSMGYTVFKLSTDRSRSSDSTFTATDRSMENEFIKVVFDNNMNISSLFDKSAQREVLLPGKAGNQITAYEDKPLKYQAWDINIYYNEKAYDINDVQCCALVENGPVRKCIRVDRKFMRSTITQLIYLEKSSKKIDFKTYIDCNHDDILLKAAFPVDVHNNEATYDIQFGNVKRPTHWNTSWDYARFEVCAHKWADLSEDDYGVSLLNDCKYGHDIKGSTMRLTLLKSAIEPYPEADRGLHEFTYSIYPHTGDFKKAHTVDQAYKLNYRPYAFYVEKGTGNVEGYKSFISCDMENVIVDTIKIAEDSNDMIIRVYECFNRRTVCNLSFGFPVISVAECDLMENDIAVREVKDDELEFEIKPYEIKTFRIR
ncbi:MAG: alpha-mannosidase [Clostridia bacterium]